MPGVLQVRGQGGKNRPSKETGEAEKWEKYQKDVVSSSPGDQSFRKERGSSVPCAVTLR